MPAADQALLGWIGRRRDGAVSAKDQDLPGWIRRRRDGAVSAKDQDLPGWIRRHNDGAMPAAYEDLFGITPWSPLRKNARRRLSPARMDRSSL